MIFTVYKRYVYFESSACYKFACKSHGQSFQRTIRENWFLSRKTMLGSYKYIFSSFY